MFVIKLLTCSFKLREFDKIFTYKRLGDVEKSPLASTFFQETPEAYQFELPESQDCGNPSSSKSSRSFWPRATSFHIVCMASVTGQSKHFFCSQIEP
jgi:hypothetical protein